MQIVQEPLSVPGVIFEECEIPSDEALVTPMVVRIIKRLQQEKLIDDALRMKMELCLDEAITNAVVHGNKSDFAKQVRVKMFRDETSWGIVIRDQGAGFKLEDLSVEDHGDGEDLWRENGRGLPLLALYIDEVRYYDGGSTLLLRQYV